MTESNEKHCQSIEPLLSGYVLGELPESDRGDVETHAASCTTCGEELRLLAATAALVAKSPPVESRLGPNERGRILRAARTPRNERKQAFRVVGLCAAAACAVAATTVFWMSQRAREEELAMKNAEIAMRGPLAPARGEDDVLSSSTRKKVSDAAVLGKLEVHSEVAPVELGSGLDLVQNLGSSIAPAPAEASRGLGLASRKVSAAAVPLPGTEQAALFEARKRDEDLKKTELTMASGATVAPGAPLALPPVTFTEEQIRTVRPGAVATEEKLPEAAPRGTALFKEVAEKDFAYREARDNTSLARRPEAESERLLRRRLAADGLEDKQPMPTAGGAGLPPKQLASRPAGAALEGLEAAQPAKPVDRYAVNAKELAQVPQPGGSRTTLDDGAARTKLSTDASGAAPASGPAKAGDEAKSLSDKPEAAPLAPAAIPQAVATASVAQPTSDFKTRVDDFLTRLDRRPGETPDMMFFRYWGDNPFVEASSDPLSTFAVDVDTASYTLARSYLYKQGVLPPPEAIRTEEFVNYFAGHYAPPPADGPAFAIHTEISASPFGHEPEYKLLRVGIKAREVPREKRKACSLVFVIDTSGSMRRENRLELVKDALKLLVKELDEGDTIGIVAFDREARSILEPAPASEKERILDAIATLQPRQNTNVAAGLDLGYRMAVERFLAKGSNRVILLSDGVANTGILDVNTMLEQVRGQRERGVYLTTVGVGMGNLNDALLEQLADRGNGQCLYVDRIEAAQKAFVEGLTGTLETVARDAKIQVELDPSKVLRYRLLGYENRAIADSAFRDNTVDAGEVGAGHEVTALYELKLKPDVTAAGAADARIATVRVRYLTVDHGEAQELEKLVSSSSARTAFGEASPRFRLHACAAELAEVLRDSYWARGSSLDRVASLLGDTLDLRESEGGPRLGEDQDVVELVALVKKADALVRRRAAETDDVARTVDALKDNIYLSARAEDELRVRGEQNRSQLEEIRRQQADLRRKLEDLLAK